MLQLLIVGTLCTLLLFCAYWVKKLTIKVKELREFSLRVDSDCNKVIKDLSYDLEFRKTNDSRVRLTRVVRRLVDLRNEADSIRKGVFR